MTKKKGEINTVDKAIKNLSSFLIGKIIDIKKLNYSIRLLEEKAPLALKRLKEELGVDNQMWSDETSSCEIFGKNAAEFSEMTESERIEEMPMMAEHLLHCKACSLFFDELINLSSPDKDDHATEAKSHLSKEAHIVKIVLKKFKKAMAIIGKGYDEIIPDQKISFAMGHQDTVYEKFYTILNVKIEELRCKLRLSVHALYDEECVALIMELVPANIADQIRFELVQIDGIEAIYGTISELFNNPDEPLTMGPGNWELKIFYRNFSKTISLLLEIE